MIYRVLMLFLLIFTSGCSEGVLKNASITHHDIEVTLNPETHELRGKDRITVDREDDAGIFAFYLNEGLEINSDNATVNTCDYSTYSKYILEKEQHGNVDGFRYYTVELDSGTDITIHFKGVIYDPLSSDESDYSRGFATTTGLVGEQGVYLAKSSAWIPSQEEGTFTFDLKTYLPAGWQSVSQGVETMRGFSEGFNVNHWMCEKPMEEVYLVAGEYVVTEEEHRGIKVMTYTYQEDEQLAGSYREATKRYLDMYNDLIGPYAFGKFALVENFWQTGYGMPSFTLLGSQVIRLPFIIHTSYGHEILHNWWGNGVYVDWDRGNWCEGITNYMADHYYKKPRGLDADYRRSMLQSYLNYVKEERDFPLLDFRERHNPATQAVGYSKSGMVFHMLYKMLGKETFLSAVRSFYKDYLFKAVSWEELQGSFEEQAGEDLGWFFDQWIARSGAPVIRIETVDVASREDMYNIDLTLSQGTPEYKLHVPVRFEGSSDTTMHVLLDGKKKTFSFELTCKPDRVVVDPEYDVFRKLDRSEIPPSLSQSLGAMSAEIVMSESESRRMREAYHGLIRRISSTDTLAVQTDASATLSSEHADCIWMAGSRNHLIDILDDVLPPNVKITNDVVIIDGESYSKSAYSFVMTFRHPDDVSRSMTWLSMADENVFPAMERKLPHYGKYGYLVFQGSNNVAKGEWDVTESPMIFTMND
jgi:hypothetical protein